LRIAVQYGATALSRRFFINGASIFGGEAISRLATAAMALVVARSFGSEALGNYGYALALASVLLIVPDLGLHLFTVRELSASPKRLAEIFWGVHWLKFGLAAAVVIFTVWFGEWAISNRERRLLFTFWSHEPCCKLFLRPRWLFSRPSSGCIT